MSVALVAAARLFPRRGAPAAISAKTRTPPRRRGVTMRQVRAHLAAQHSGLLADWVGTSASANVVTEREGRKLRQRARELRENSALVAKYESLCVTNILGPEGVTFSAYVPRPRGKNVDASAALEADWYRWVTRATVSGESLHSVLQRFVASWKIEGEGLLRSRLVGDRLVVESLDPDLLDQDYTETLRNGNVVVQGIEMTDAGEVVAFHIWDGPIDQYGRRKRERWAAEWIDYLPHRIRPQQTRGITALAPVMILIQHLERMQEAVVVLNRVTASKMYTLEAEQWADPIIDEETNERVPPTADEEIEPGNSWITPYGWKTKMLDPGQPTAQHDAMVKLMWGEVCAGLNVSYMSLTGDLTNATYSSGKIGLWSEREGWSMDHVALTDAVLRRLFARWLRIEVLARRITLPPNVLIADVVALSEWHGRKWPMLEPLKDAQAIKLLIAERMTSRTRELNKLGIDYRKVIDELADEEAYAKEKGVSLAAATNAVVDAVTSASDAEDDDAPNGAPPKDTP